MGSATIVSRCTKDDVISLGVLLTSMAAIDDRWTAMAMDDGCTAMALTAGLRDHWKLVGRQSDIV